MGACEAPRTGEPRPDGKTDDRLQSWKELAAYLKRGARTVQRWEREEGLPVRRLPHGRLGSIYGYKSELDAWWAARGEELSNEPPQTPSTTPSVAVMPFADLSAEKDQGYFCDGILQEILHSLGRINGLRTTTGSSGRRQPGRALGRQSRLEGSVRRYGGRWRVAVQLLDSEDGSRLWSERFDRECGDILRVQDEIAVAVSRAVAAALGVSDGPAPSAREQAGECYRRGREFYYRYNPAGMEFAIQLFVRAIETDPGCAEAYAGLADCWSFTYLYDGRSAELREQADWASLRAVEMDPRSAQAHASRGLALSLDGRNQDAGLAFESAARLDPGLFEAHYYHACHCFSLGQREKAAELFLRAMEAKPSDYQAPLLCAQVYGESGRSAEASEIRKRGIRAAEEHLKLHPDDARAFYLAAYALATSGEATRARQFAERARAIAPEDPILLYHLERTFSLLG